MVNIDFAVDIYLHRSSFTDTSVMYFRKLSLVYIEISKW
jgi:hypothetical protein